MSKFHPLRVYSERLGKWIVLPVRGGSQGPSLLAPQRLNSSIQVTAAPAGQDPVVVSTEQLVTSNNEQTRSVSWDITLPRAYPVPQYIMLNRARYDPDSEGNIELPLDDLDKFTIILPNGSTIPHEGFVANDYDIDVPQGAVASAAMVEGLLAGKIIEFRNGQSSEGTDAVYFRVAGVEGEVIRVTPLPYSETPSEHGLTLLSGGAVVKWFETYTKEKKLEGMSLLDDIQFLLEKANEE